VETDLVETRSYYLDFVFNSTFDEHLGTSLSQGNEFPHYIKSGFTDVSVTYGEVNTVRVMG
jgi:hypothetical protein